MTPPRLPEFWVSKTRLETLMDGVFAIAMTLMVLEIKVPELQNRHSMPELMVQVGHNLAPILGFIISFLVLGIFWYKHHRQYHLIHRVDSGLLAINLAFLMGVALFPFAAGIIGRFPGNPGVLFIYMPCLAFLWICLTAQFGYARRKGLLDPELDAEAATFLHRLNMMGALGVTLVSGLYIAAALLVEHAGQGREWLSFVPLIMVPFAVTMKRWRKRHGL